MFVPLYLTNMKFFGVVTYLLTKCELAVHKNPKLYLESPKSRISRFIFYSPNKLA
jgi:hypothetical protein